MAICERLEQPAELPVGGEVSDQLWQRVAEGQPVALTRRGRIVAVVVEAGSWSEVEDLLALAAFE